MDGITNLLCIAYERFTRNLRGTLEGMSPEKWIRIVIIVGTYMLLRPYLLKLGGKAQMNQHEKEAAEAEAEAEAKAKLSPNELRGHRVQIPEDSDDSDAEGEGGEGRKSSTATATDWGKKARRRQRTMVKKLLDAEEKRLQELQEDDEDKDIEEFLTQ
ncbi:putative trafficking pga2 [Diaporthe ampelina]|uniref:Putative trafficking pga2 n=1 Tax=Diaporthe ampelina TaxID=1214573 RepID=A0A0G2F5U8_9PEZI|nr:putative trafficking pga2 [Diaporthe ampelina]